MSNRLRVTLFVFVIISVLAISAEPVSALPFDIEETNTWVTAGDYFQNSAYRYEGDILNCYLETDDTTMLLDFYIFDDGNFTIWDAGSSAWGYGNEHDVHTNYFEFTIPYDDIWHIVFSNRDGSSGVYVDIAIDTDGTDNRPFYSGYDYEINYQLLETDEWYYVSNALTVGSEISGHYSTFFTTDGVDVLICDSSTYDDWAKGISVTVDVLIEDYHISSIDTFTVPYTDTWYVVFSALDEIDAVTVSFGVDFDTGVATTTDPTTTTSPTTSEPPPPTDGTSMISVGALGFIGLIALIGICVCVNKRKKGAPPTQPFDSRGYPPSGPTGDVRSSDEVILGALKSYPRVSMSELGNILGLPESQVRRTTLKLIGAGAIRGTFDKNTDEFTSLAATSVGREMRDDYRDAFELPRCPNCGAQLTKTLVAGETFQCESCGSHITG